MTTNILWPNVGRNAGHLAIDYWARLFSLFSCLNRIPGHNVDEAPETKERNCFRLIHFEPEMWEFQPNHSCQNYNWIKALWKAMHFKRFGSGVAGCVGFLEGTWILIREFPPEKMAGCSLLAIAVHRSRRVAYMTFALPYPRWSSCGRWTAKEVQQCWEIKKMCGDIPHAQQPQHILCTAKRDKQNGWFDTCYPMTQWFGCQRHSPLCKDFCWI